MDTRPIGMFDSGVGGLTVLKEIQKKLPNEDIIYLGDTKRFPYGSKSKESIIEIAKECVKFLISKNVKMIVIACGTATTQSLDSLKEEFNIPIIGIIEPTINYIENSNHRNIGVIATEGSIHSKVWDNKIQKIGRKIQSKAAPLLAPMAEQGWTENDIARSVIKEYMKEFDNIDALILGCTHYPLYTNVIKNELGEKVEIINMGEKLAESIKPYLNKNKLENNKTTKGNYEIYLTDTETNFENVACKLLKDEKVKGIIKKVEI